MSSSSLLIIVSDEQPGDSNFLKLFPTITNPTITNNVYQSVKKIWSSTSENPSETGAITVYNLIDDAIFEFKYNKFDEKKGNIRVFYADTIDLENKLFLEIKNNLANHHVYLLGYGPKSSMRVSNVCNELVKPSVDGTQISIDKFFPFTINSIGDETINQPTFVKKYYIVTKKDCQNTKYNDPNFMSMNKIKMAYDALIVKGSLESDYKKKMWEKFFKMKHVIGSDLGADFMKWWNSSTSQQIPPSKKKNIQESFVQIHYHYYENKYIDSQGRRQNEQQFNSLQVYCRQDKNNKSFYLYQEDEDANADPKLPLVAILLDNETNDITKFSEIEYSKKNLEKNLEKIKKLDSFRNQGGRRYRRSNRMKITKRKNRKNRKTRRK